MQDALSSRDTLTCNEESFCINIAIDVEFMSNCSIMNLFNRQIEDR